MPIFKYTLIKYIKAKSTWVIAAISGILIAFLLGGLVPFISINTNSTDAATKYTLTIVSTIAGVTSFLSIFASVFAGFKAASMYKDEVEDGTFLVILSKPMKRSSIILYKWLALQAVILGWALFTVICFIAGLAAFDKGSQIKDLKVMGVSTITSQLPKVGGLILLILYVTGLIFSSIALLISTRLSVGSTIGISIALGIIIPITSLVGIFVKNEPFKKLSNSEMSIQERNFKITDSLNGIDPNDKNSISSQINEFRTSKSLEDLYKLGINTNESDGYKFAWIIDLNYQISQLSSIATEQVIPDSAKEYAKEVNSDSSSSAPGQSSGKIESTSLVKTLANKWDNSSVIKDINEALKDYFGMAGKMADAQTRAITTVLQAANPNVNVTLPNNDIRLLTYIYSQVATNLQSQGQLSWINDLSQDSKHPVTIQNILDLLNYVYGNSDYNTLLDSGKYANSPVPGDEVNWFKFQINQLGKNLITDLSTAKMVATDTVGNLKVKISELVKIYGETIDKLNNPVSAFMLNEEALKSSTKDIQDKEFTYKDAAGADQKDTYINVARKALEDSSLNNFANLLSSKDVETIAQVLSASLAGELNEVQSVDYVGKTTLLAAYIVIALALVPIAYFVVKKQDFR